MNAKKFLALVIAFAMIMGAMCFSAMADGSSAGDIAMVGTTYYSSLADAIAAASQGDVISLLEGEFTFASGEALTIDKPVTIKGAGKGLTVLNFDTPRASAITVASGNVTIEDMDICQASTDEATHISISKGAWDAPSVQYSDITYRNVAFKGGRYALCIIGENIVIDSCDFIDQASDSVLVYSVRGNSQIINNNFAKATGNNKYAINFEGGPSTTLTPEQVDAFEANGTLTISGNTATSKGVFFIFNNWGYAEGLILDISDNTVDAFTNKGIVFYGSGTGNETGEEFAQININDNAFVNVPEGRAVIRDERTVQALAINAQDNYWGSEEPDFSVVADEGNVAVYPYFADEEKLISVPAAVEVDGVQFGSLQDAINAAADGATITVLSDIVLESQDARSLFEPAYNVESYCGVYIPDDKAIVLELNGKTISYVDEFYNVNNVMILNLGNLTIKDSVGGGKITYKPVEGGSRYSKYYSTIFNCGTLTINGGIIENTCDTDIDVTNAVDNHSRLSHEYNNDCILTVNGGELRGSEYYAIRQYTHYLEGVKNRVIINDGLFYGGIYMQHGDSWYYADPSKNRLDVDCQLVINGGTFESNYDGALSVKSNLNNPDNELWKLEINGGTFEGGINLLVQKGYYYLNGSYGETAKESQGASNEAWIAENGGFISGGIFDDIGIGKNDSYNVAKFLVDGYALSPTSNGGAGVVEEELIVEEIYVTFSEVAASEESEKLYNINLSAPGKVINRLNSADLTFALEPISGTNKFEIIDIENDNITFNPVYNPADGSVIDGRYEFHFEHKDNVTNDTATTITLAQVKFTGYGKFDFEIVGDTNAAHATTIYDNVVDTFVPDGSLNGDKDLIVDASISDEIIVPKRDLTIRVSFPNTINPNSKDYQDMTITVAGAEGYVNEIALGNGTLSENLETDAKGVVYYEKTISGELTLNTPYTVTVEGAGYRTVKYTVNMTEDKELNFWNNVKDNEVYVEEGLTTGTEKYAQTVTFLAGDIVKDNEINVYDLSAVVSYFGEIDLDENNKPLYAKYDLNRDGKIDSKDVAYVLVSWGK